MEAGRAGVGEAMAIQRAMNRLRHSVRKLRPVRHPHRLYTRAEQHRIVAASSGPSCMASAGRNPVSKRFGGLSIGLLMLMSACRVPGVRQSFCHISGGENQIAREFMVATAWELDFQMAGSSSV